MNAVRHHIHTNLGLDVDAVEAEHEHHVGTPPHVDPHAREEMSEGWRPDHGTNFGLVLPVDDDDARATPDRVVVTTRPALRVLAVEERVEMAAIGSAMQSAFGRLFGAVQRAGVEVIGPPFSRYPEMPSDQVRFELCVPIALDASVDPGAVGHDVHDVDVPDCTVATMHFIGAYDAIGPAWQRLLGWVADHDHRVVGPLEEVYLDDPDACGPHGPETLMIVPID